MPYRSVEIYTFFKATRWSSFGFAMVAALSMQLLLPGNSGRDGFRYGPLVSPAAAANPATAPSGKSSARSPGATGATAATGATGATGAGNFVRSGVHFDPQSSEVYYSQSNQARRQFGVASGHQNSVNQRFKLAQHLIVNEHILDGRRILIPLCHRPETTARMYTLLARTYIEDPEQDPKMNGEIERDLKMAMSLDPNDGMSFRWMANFCNLQGQYKESLIYADKAIKAKLTDNAAYREKAVSYSNLGRFDEAIKALDSLIAVSGPSDSVFTSKAKLLEKLKRYPAAEAAYRQSIAARNQDTTVFLLVHCLDLDGKYQEAITELNKQLKVNPDDSEALAMRARLAAKNKNIPMALADLSKAIDLEPTSKLYNERAAIFASLGKQDAAARDLAQARRLDAKPFDRPY
ncbi:MAG: tetratricopeptide repeat protein [Cyanobacteria bacterium REEB67]|nr:tetratricopeptide repeat protein [Cyanobacteria bacterium REEB67]